MPCDTSWEIVQAFTAENQTLVLQALAQVGCTNIRVRTNGRIQFTTPAANIGRIADGEITVDQSDEALINPLKRAYAVALLQDEADRFNWTMTVEDNQVVMTRSTY